MSEAENILEMPKYEVTDQSWHPFKSPETLVVEREEWEPLTEEIDVVLMTATDSERNAVMHLLKPYPQKRKILLVYSGPETYYLGKFGNYKAVVTKCEMGATGQGGAILAAGDAIDLWYPKAIIMVGIAFGKDRKTQKIGDVLVASQIISYEQQRIGNEYEINHRGDIPRSNQILLNRFKNSENWIFTRPDDLVCKLIIGAILSGEKLVDNQEFKDKLFQQFPQAKGGEMEGAGLYAAASRTDTAWILVKSICDWADGTKSDKHQELAAAAAASLVHHVLSLKTVLDGLEKKNINSSIKPRKGINRNPRSTEDKNSIEKELEVALYGLNHFEQCQLFDGLNERSKAVGLLVKNKTRERYNFAITWLLKSLLKEIQDDDSSRFELHLDTHAVENGGFQKVLDEISRQLCLSGCKPGTNADAIIDKIFTQLQRGHHIILIFYGVGRKRKRDLDPIVNKFWKPLMKKLKEETTKYNLLMFWIDDQDTNDWRVDYKIPNDHQKNSPVGLYSIDVIDRFQRDDLNGWVKNRKVANVINKLNSELLITLEKTNLTIETIWHESQEGEPKALLQTIYRLCKLHWEAYEKIWNHY